MIQVDRSQLGAAGQKPGQAALGQIPPSACGEVSQVWAPACNYGQEIVVYGAGVQLKVGELCEPASEE